MRIGIAADHGGYGLKQDLRGRLAAAGHDVIDFGAKRLDSRDVISACRETKRHQCAHLHGRGR